MSHYYENDEKLPQNRKEITFRFLGVSYEMISDDGVFSKDTLDYGTRVLIETVNENNPCGNLLDLGCGYGPVGIILKQLNPELGVTMIDVNDRALQLAELNSKRYEQDNNILKNENLALQNFDVICTNPPIRCGKQVIYQMFLQGYQALNSKGALYVVMRKNHGALSAQKEIQRLFNNCDVIKKDSGYYILRAIKD